MVYSAKSLDPLRMLQVYDADNYELMIEDWQRGCLNTKYKRVERLGGSGDKGRDILCTDYDDETYFYQCKHYDRPLNKSEALLEIGKCCYYCNKGDYKTPKEYYLVSPHGVSIRVRDLLDSPEELKKELKSNWSRVCKTKITNTENVKLEGNLLNYIDELDFSIFDYVSPKDFIDSMKATAYYSSWFFELTKPRDLEVSVPSEIGENEFIYIQKSMCLAGSDTPQ